MRRIVSILLFVILCLGLLGIGASMPSAGVHPAAADAWILEITPVPPVGPVH
jgi:hypothetical protein